MALNVLAETVTLSRAIDATPPLRWYDALGRRDVLLTRFVAHIGFFVVGFGLFTVPALVSLWAARRLGPQVPIRRVGSIEVPDLSRPAAAILVGVILVGGLVSGLSWGGRWPTLLLFFNGGAFGLADAAFGRDYQKRGLAIVAISANDVRAYPADSPERMAEEAKAAGYTFPYLYDETQEVARAYGAACTPDFFLFDRRRELAYRGQFDASRPSNGVPVSGADLRAACDAVLAGRAAPAEQRPSIGCNIKWKPGNAPG